MAIGHVQALALSPSGSTMARAWRRWQDRILLAPLRPARPVSTFGWVNAACDGRSIGTNGPVVNGENWGWSWSFRKSPIVTIAPHGRERSSAFRTRPPAAPIGHGLGVSGLVTLTGARHSVSCASAWSAVSCRVA